MTSPGVSRGREKPSQASHARVSSPPAPRVQERRMDSLFFMKSFLSTRRVTEVHQLPDRGILAERLGDLPAFEVLQRHRTREPKIRSVEAGELREQSREAGQEVDELRARQV